MNLFSRVTLAAAALAVGVLGQTADAGVIYSTFGPGHSYKADWAWAILGSANTLFPGLSSSNAVPFTPLADAELGQINLALSNPFGVNDGARVSLRTKSGSFPDVELKSWHVNLLPRSLDDTIVTINDITGIHLAAGVTYYVVVEPPDPTSDTVIDWYYNSLGTKGVLGGYLTGIGWWDYPDEVLPAFDVLSADVPEPATITLMLAGAAGVVRLKGRKRAK